MKLSLYIILIFITQIIYSQNGRWAEISWEKFEVITTEISRQYEIENYTLDVIYNTYKGKQTTIPFETSKGYIQKSKNKQYTYFLGITTIDTKELKVTVDSTNNLIAVNYGSEGLNNELILDQYKQVKNLVVSVKMKEDDKTNDLQINYNKTSPVSRVEIKVDKKKQIKEIIVFYSNPKEYFDEFGETKSDYVNLKIEYTNFEKKIIHKELEINQIITNTKNGFILKPEFKEFELIDFRLKN